MNHKSAGIKSTNIGVVAWAILGLLPCSAIAQVTGVWDTTALTRIDVTPINDSGLIPEHTVDIYDGNYEFNPTGDFNAGDINGPWTQKKRQYSVKVNRLNLENQYRASMIEQEPNIVINKLKLSKSSLIGYELDNGIWGTERYEYKIDTTFGGFRDVIRLVMTVQVAGKQPTVEPTLAKSARVFMDQPTETENLRNPAIDAAVSVILKQIRQRNPNQQ